MAHRVVGIDFGHDRIRGVEVEDPGTRRERVLRRGAVPLEPGALASGEVRDVPAVAAALGRLWQQAGFRTRRVVLGLGNARVLVRDLEVPARPREQIREQLHFLVADLLPMPTEQAVLDFHPVREVTDERGAEHLAGLLVVALNEVAMTNARAATQARLEVVGIDLIPFALVRRLADPDSRETVAFVDVGATTTIVTVAVGRTPVFCRIVPAGGEEVTRSLIELGQLSREQAEQVKRTIGLTAEGVEPRYRPVVELMVTRTSELMTSIRDTLSYFVDNRGQAVERIVLTGGGARLGGFAEMVAAWTRIPTELADTDPDAEFLVATALADGARHTAARQQASRRAATAAPSASAAAPVGPEAEPAASGKPHEPSGPPDAAPEPLATDTAAAPIIVIDEPPAGPSAPGPSMAAPSSREPSASEETRLGMPGGIAPEAPEARPSRGRFGRGTER